MRWRQPLIAGLRRRHERTCGPGGHQPTGQVSWATLGDLAGVEAGPQPPARRDVLLQADRPSLSSDIALALEDHISRRKKMGRKR